MKQRLFLALLIVFAIGMVHAQDVEECCEIVAIDAQEGTIRLEIGDSGRTFTLQIGSADVFGSMQIGENLEFEGEEDWESFEEGQNLIPAGIEGLDPTDFDDCCNIVDVDFGIEGEAIPTQRLAKGVTFEVVDMHRVNKNVLHFSFAIDNQTDEIVNPMNYGILHWVGSGPTRIANGVELHDLVGLKSYRAGTASESRDLDVAPGARREYWAQYQAPPEGVTALTVILSDAPPLYDVSIQ